MEPLRSASGPMSVRILEAEAPKAVTTPQPQTAPPAAPPRAAPPKARPRREPPLLPPPVVAEAPKIPMPPPEPQPTPTTPPPVDLMAMVEARREARRKANEGKGSPEPPVRGPRTDDVALANINRNLATLRDRGEGVGGVFQVLRKGVRTAEFAFNGWRPDANRSWREVIEVDAGPGGDVEKAIVRRMIELIRTHYNGDFQWESHRLERVVTLSARVQDTEGLEEFMIREFFGSPGFARSR